MELLSFHTYVEMTIRLLITLVLCGAIGLQRATTGKPAGIRTHILVGVGAALMTLVSAYAFPDFPASGRDPTRLAAQIVSGIGFLGAGMILKEGLTVRGLTSAASLWAVAGIGIACGSGLAILACITTVMILLTLLLIGRLEAWIPQQHRVVWTLNLALADSARLGELRHALRAECPTVHLVAMETGEEGKALQFTFALLAARHFDIVSTSLTLRALGAGDLRWKADAVGEELI